jgi:hypothetical protein
VKRKFLFAQTGGTGFTTDVRMPYLDAELNTNTEGNLVTWQNVSSVWNGRLTPVTRDGASNYVGTTGLTTTEIANEWKLADPKYTMNATALLTGPWNGSTMNVTMNSGGLLDAEALGQPYNTTPFNYAGTESVSAGFFAAHPTIVDWVLCELRIPTSGLPADATSSTIVGRKAGFLLNNGTVVDLDGSTPISFDISKQGAGFIVIRHRNHLGVMSNSLPSNATGAYSNDFKVLANSYMAPGASSNPLVLLSGGVYGLWPGDANKNGAINATDVSTVKIAIANSTTGYQLTDINLSNSINATDVSAVKNSVSNSSTGSAPARTIATGSGPARMTVTTVKTNIPDPIGPEE